MLMDEAYVINQMCLCVWQAIDGDGRDLCYQSDEGGCVLCITGLQG